MSLNKCGAGMKKEYVKPFIEVITVCTEASMMNPDSYRIYDKAGNLVGGGTIVEDEMPPDAEDEDLAGLAKRANYDPWDFD